MSAEQPDQPGRVLTEQMCCADCHLSKDECSVHCEPRKTTPARVSSATDGAT